MKTLFLVLALALSLSLQGQNDSSEISRRYLKEYKERLKEDSICNAIHKEFKEYFYKNHLENIRCLYSVTYFYKDCEGSYLLPINYERCSILEWRIRYYEKINGKWICIKEI